MCKGANPPCFNTPCNGICVKDICEEIVADMCGRCGLRQVVVEPVSPKKIIVKGQTGTYHLKQLALEAAKRHTPPDVILVLEVNVTT